MKNSFGKLRVGETRKKEASHLFLIFYQLQNFEYLYIIAYVLHNDISTFNHFNCNDNFEIKNFVHIDINCYTYS